MATGFNGFEDVAKGSSGETMTLIEILPMIRQLPAFERLRLIRILAEELETSEEIYPFEHDKTYMLPTPCNTFGAGQALAEALATFEAKGQ